LPPDFLEMLIRHEFDAETSSNYESFTPVAPDKGKTPDILDGRLGFASRSRFVASFDRAVRLLFHLICRGRVRPTAD
jgi:hypothetical protein